MKLSDKHIPTCPHCGMAKLEVADVIDSWEEHLEDGTPIMVELTVGTCPNCNHDFEYKQQFSHEPIGYECVDDVTEDEED